MTRVRDSHGFTALKVEGGMFPDGYLRTIASLEAPHQQGSDYGLSRSLVVKEELARFWRISNDLYSRYSKQRLRQDLSVKQDRVAVDDWLVPLLSGVFGYNDLTPTSDVELGERVFKLTHRAAGGVVPFLLVSDDFALDKADVRLGHEGRRQAPHMLMQEYLNAEERSLWGFTSNGSKLRLLRDNPSLTRPSYIEIDFELMFEEHLYPDFAALWLATHASRLTPTNGKPSDCIIENWRTQAHETGVRVLESLRVGVTDALQHMGNGFLEHPQNSRLKQDLRSGQLTYDGYFQQLLRLVYRMLFMFTAEERDLLHTRGATAWQREVFAAGYSLSRLRERALRRRYYDRHCDIWYSLQITFRAVNEGTEALGLPALGGLFQNEQCVDLDAAVITNKRLLDAIRSLAFFRSGTTLARVNYRDMDTEELGSVYESLLELQPVVELGCTHMGGSVREAAFSFAGADSDENVKGSARKLTGSYYTPSSLVHELVKSALEPVLKDAIAERPENPRQAILDIKVIDPACGSGHFLLAAARRMAAEIARLEADYGTADEMVRQHALREVVQHSIHGVDRNPLAVELCKTALWMETVEPGKPLTFLNAHIQLGDSLVGILDPEIMSDGIPAGAYKPLTSDDKATCTALKKRNKQTGEFDNLTLFDPDEMLEVARIAADVDALPEDTLGDIKQKNAAWKAALSDPALTRERLRANLFVGAYFAQKTPQTAAWVPLTEDINRLNVEPQHATPAARHPEIYAKTAELARKHYFFHWHLAFADIMQKGGFNVVLGNPPWERIKLQEQEFFATRSREIATAPNKAARSRLIKQLALKDARPAERAMFRDFETAKRESEAISQFVRTARRFPLTGVGDINTYAVFAETILDLINPQGRAGLITPTGIATDNSRRAFFNAVVTGRRLVSLYDFENKEQVFPDVHRSYKFCLLTLSGVDQPCQEAEFAFFLHNTEQLGARERHISLSSEDFALFNPNTRTCPIFRTQQDIEIARKMYLRAGVLWQEKRDGQPEMNPWNISFQLMFQMSSDSRLFRTREKLNEEGWELEGNVFMRNGEQYLPLYEAKLFHQYDHRFATFEGVPAAKARKGQARNVTSAEKASPEKVILPRYWIPEEEVMKKLDGSTGGKVDMGSRTNARQTQLIDHQLDAIHKQSSKVIAPPRWRNHSTEIQHSTDSQHWLAARFQKDHRRSQRTYRSLRHDSSSRAQRLRYDDPDWLIVFRDIAGATNQRTSIFATVLGTAVSNKAPLLKINYAEWLQTFRSIARATDERTILTGSIPWSGVGNSAPVIDYTQNRAIASALVLANMNSLPLDWAARSSIGGVNMNFFIVKQLPVLPPEAYLARAHPALPPYVELIIPRVLELTYTAYDLEGFARDIGYHGPPFQWDDECRHCLQSELDAVYAHMYGLDRSDMEWILDAEPPSSSFPALKRKELAEFGEYRTQRYVLEAYDLITKGEPPLIGAVH